MRVAVYTICKNEQQFVKRFMSSIKNEADMIIVTDTGSTDNTVKLLREEGAIVHEIKVDPWRFDVPRNISLQFVPEDVDVCVCIDLDEILTPGWREAIEQSWTPATTRLRYQYVWNTLPDGRPGITFWYDKIHRRKGYRWVKPVHEVLEYYEGPETQTYCDKFTLYHYPDQTKSRGNYLPLLEMGCREQPNDDRNCHYLGREYMFYGMWDQSINELQRHLSLPSATWKPERAASMRYIARCYVAKKNYQEAEIWALKACAEAPGEREPWVDLGKIFYYQQKWSGVYFAMTTALSIIDKPATYICEPAAWNEEPFDYASIAASNLGMDKAALALAERAAALSPLDERLQKNVLLLKQKIQ